MSTKHECPTRSLQAARLPDLLSHEQVMQLVGELAPKEVFNTVEAAEFLGVSKQLLELLRVQGGGPRYAKLQRLVRYRRSALDDWLSNLERNHTSGL